MVSRTTEPQEEFWLTVLAIVGMLSLAGVIGIVFWYGIHYQLGYIGVRQAEGYETQTVSLDLKWDDLLKKYPQIRTPQENKKEDSKEHVDPLQEPALSGSIKMVQEPEKKQDRTLSAVQSFIKYANPKLGENQVSTLATSLVKWADHYNLPVGLVVGVAHAESNFRVNAQGVLVGGHRAVGPMQIMWPMHQPLAKQLGIRNKQAMFGDSGVKIGCHILKTYIKDEQSVIGGLKRYLSALSKVYILEKVMTGWIVVEQLEAGTITEEELRNAHQTEKNYMRRITTQRK